MIGFDTMRAWNGAGTTRLFQSVLALLLSFMISGCLIIEIEITESVEAGGEVTLRIVVQEDAAEQSTPWRGIQIVTVPEDWAFVSGEYTADDIQGPVGTGDLEEDPAWADSAEIGLGPAPDGFKYIALASDQGYLHADTLIVESTVILQAGQTNGDFNIGVTVTKDGYYPSNGDWFGPNLNGADSTTAKTTVTGGTGAIPITLADMNHIPQADLDSLADLGADMTLDQYTYMMLPQDLLGEVVTFTAVIASNPYSSGRASVSDGRVNRIHVLVVDTTANSGPADASYWGEIVDGRYEDTGTLDLFVGDVVKVTAELNFFNQSTNIEPVSYEVLGTMADFGISESILDPIVVESSDLNIAVEGGFQGNVREWPRLGKRYVRLEGAVVTSRIVDPEGEPHFAVTTDGGETSVEFSNSSIVFRNDRPGVYPDEFNHRGEVWTPPPPGSVINFSGYAIAQGDIRLTTSVPTFAQVNVMPWEASDIEILESPPQVGDPVGPSEIPGADPVTVTVDVVADAVRQITGVNLYYAIGPDEEAADSVAMANTSDNTWSGDIPALEDGSIVRYWTKATDNTGSTGQSIVGSYRVLVDGINEIADIQETFSGGEGDSPLMGFTTPMDVWAVVQSRHVVSGMLTVQDSEELSGWSGIQIQLTEGIEALGLVPGDSVHVTAGRIIENNGVPGFDSQRNSTTIADAVLEKGGSMADAAGFGYKEVTSADLGDDAVAEAHESMLVNFAGVVITDNEPNPFGDWLFSSAGDSTELFGEDASPGFLGNGVENFETGMGLEFLRGIWTQAFGTFRLLPEDNDDAGDEVSTAIETTDAGIPERFALDQNYPNPFNPTTTISFDLGDATHARLDVFDVTGRLVESLVDQQLSAGSYRVTFDAASLTSGVYLYRLQAGGSVVTKRMLLLK